MADFTSWIEDFGGAEVMENCSGMNLSVEFDTVFPEGCGDILVDFIATSECGIQSTMQAVFSFFDAIDPVLITPPQNLLSPCSGHISTEVDQWLDVQGGALAADDCSTVEWTHDFAGDLSSDSVEVVFTVLDACGNELDVSAWMIREDGVEFIFDTLYNCIPDTAMSDTIIDVNGSCITYTIRQYFPLPADTSYGSAIVCDPLLAGSDTSRFINQYGCDSLFILSSVLATSDTIVLESFTCDSDEVASDTIWLFTINGCDSLVIHSVVYAGDSFVKEEVVKLCGSGLNYADTINVPGVLCDTILVTTYQFTPLDTTLVTTRVCHPGDTGTSSMVLQNVNGCDSTILTTNVYVQVDSIIIIENRCFGQDTVVEGLLFSDQYGCDSLFVTFYLINVTPDTQFVFTSSCDSSLTGVITTSIPGPLCDTIRVTETTWTLSYVTRDSQSVCAPSVMTADTFYFISVEGCDSLWILEYVQDGPQLEVIALDEACLADGGGIIQVTAVNGGIPPYLFSLNSQTFDTVTVWDSLLPGSYSVIVQDSDMCQDTVHALEINPGVAFIIDAGPDMTVSVGDFLPLQLPSATNWSTGLWTALDSLSCPNCPVTQLGPVTQEQNVVVEVTNDAGCVSSDSLRVYLEEVISYYVPNVFSPDFDGVNDYFFLASSDESGSLYDMVVFDRWGNQIFNEVDISSNSPTSGWNGSFRGQKLNPGVFIYMIDVKADESILKRLTGNVTLIR